MSIYTSRTKSTDSDASIPSVAFLGVCDGLQREINFDPRLTSLSVSRLRSEVVSHIFPLPLRGLNIVLAAYNPLSLNSGRLVCRNTQGSDLFYIQPTGVEVIPPTEILSPGAPDQFKLDPSALWIVVGLPWPDVFPIITKPEPLLFFWIEGDQQFELGIVNFLHAPAPPLSIERIAAIKSDPMATKGVRITLACTKCRTTMKAYAALDRSADDEASGFKWYRDLPEQFFCSCGGNNCSLALLRENLHAFLGHRFVRAGEELSFTRVYEQSTLESVYDRFRHLLDRDPDESHVQIFFNENPVLLHIFSPDKIFVKPTILGRYFTDFVVLSKSGHLRLIEIERPGKRLLKQDGGRTAEFTHAWDQVLDWQHQFSNHKLAILDTLGLKPEEVTKVGGVVIIGRDQGHDRGQLLKLKSANLGAVELFTYDDILANLEGLIVNLANL